MPDLKSLAKIDVKMDVNEMNGHYDIKLGQDILTKLGIVLDFEQKWSGGAMKLSKRGPLTAYNNCPTLSATRWI